MAKWADYGISKVRYNKEHTHIIKVLVAMYFKNTFGTELEYGRTEIVSMIKKGFSYITLIKGPDGNWMKGQPVLIYTLNGTEYIKTEENDKEIDNLENLSEF